MSTFSIFHCNKSMVSCCVYVQQNLCKTNPLLGSQTIEKRARRKKCPFSCYHSKEKLNNKPSTVNIWTLRSTLKFELSAFTH